MSAARHRLYLTVSPGASRSEISRADGGFRARVAAPAHGGKANRALVSFLSDRLDVPVSRIVILRGAAGRHKVIEIHGLTEEETLRRLGLL